MEFIPFFSAQKHIFIVITTYLTKGPTAVFPAAIHLLILPFMED